MPQFERCVATLDNGRHRCSARVWADAYCHMHHPTKHLAAKADKQQQVKLAQLRERQHIHHDFWCQVSICALMLYLHKAAPEWADALVRKL